MKKTNYLKKEYYTAMLGLCTILSFTGCQAKELLSYGGINYNIENYKEGKLSYDDVYTLKIKVYNISGEIKMHLISNQNSIDYDVITGLAIPDDTVVYETSIINYLLFYEKIQKKYTLNDLENILENIKEDFILNNEGKLSLKK